MTTVAAAQDEKSYASRSMTRHLARGAVGFGALAASVALVPAVGPVSLLLAPLGLLALRGCPTCWAIGLVQTMSRGRWERTCQDGSCQLARRPDRADGIRADGIMMTPRPAASSGKAAAAPS